MGTVHGDPKGWTRLCDLAITLSKCLKAGIPYELINFKTPNRRKEKKNPKALAENELSTKGKTKQ